MALNDLASQLRKSPGILFHHLELPDLILFPDVASLSQVGLSVRAINALSRFSRRTGIPLGSLRARDIVGIPNVGSKTLIEILSASEAHLEAYHAAYTLEDLQALSVALTNPQGNQASEQVTEAAQAKLHAILNEVRSKEWASILRTDDPLFSQYVQGFDLPTTSIRATAEDLVDATSLPAPQADLERAFRELLQAADAREEMTASEEVGVIVQTLTRGDAASNMIAARFGLLGADPATLDAVGRQQAVTRERVRQVEAEFRRNLGKQPVWMPRLNAALEVVRALAPCFESKAQEALGRAGLASSTEDLETVLRFAKAIGCEPSVTLSNGALLSPEHTTLAITVTQHAGKLTEHLGCANLAELAAKLGRSSENETLLKLLVSVDPTLSWLDDPGDYFWMNSKPRNRLLNQTEKIMSLAGSCELTTLRDGISRHHRMRNIRPPHDILSRLLVDSGLYQQDGSRIIVGPEIPPWEEVLSASEVAIAEVLFEQGPLMTRADMREELVMRRGMKSASFAAYLTYSPILERFALGVFGLRGTEVSGSQLEAFRSSAEGPRQKVLLDSGWTKEGLPWSAYRLSSATLETGVVGVPAGLAGTVSGEFGLLAAGNDTELIGQLGIRDGTMWGLTTLFRRRRPEPGDHLVVCFDLLGGVATAHLGSWELVEGFAEA
jgi:hypothetical protein